MNGARVTRRWRSLPNSPATSVARAISLFDDSTIHVGASDVQGLDAGSPSGIHLPVAAASAIRDSTSLGMGNGMGEMTWISAFLQPRWGAGHRRSVRRCGVAPTQMTLNGSKVKQCVRASLR